MIKKSTLYELIWGSGKSLWLASKAFTAARGQITGHVLHLLFCLRIEADLEAVRGCAN